MSTITIFPLNRGSSLVTTVPGGRERQTGRGAVVSAVVTSVGGLRCWRPGAPRRPTKGVWLRRPGVEDPDEAVTDQLSRDQVDERSVEMSDRELAARGPAPERAVVPGIGEDRAPSVRPGRCSNSRMRGDLRPSARTRRPTRPSSSGGGRLDRPAASRGPEGDGPRPPIADVRVGPDQGIPLPHGANGGGVVARSRRPPCRPLPGPPRRAGRKSPLQSWAVALATPRR